VDPAEQAFALRSWWICVSDYSKRNLTNHRDWLAAMAGVTQYFINEAKLSPLLGLWKDSLVHDLSWTVAQDTLWFNNASSTTTEGATKRSQIANIPSWSWLQVEARIKPPHLYASDGVIETFTEILEAHVTWAATSLTSSIQSTKLIVTGPIAWLDIGWEGFNAMENVGLVLLDQKEPEFGVYCPDELLETVYERSYEYEYGCGTERYRPPVPCLALAAYAQDYDLRMYALGDDVASTAKGVYLALREIGSDGSGVQRYARVGVGEWDASPGVRSPLEGVERRTIELG
jgi:hypothetical protein